MILRFIYILRQRQENWNYFQSHCLCGCTCGTGVNVLPLANDVKYIDADKPGHAPVAYAPSTAVIQIFT